MFCLCVNLFLCVLRVCVCESEVLFMLGMYLGLALSLALVSTEGGSVLICCQK